MTKKRKTPIKLSYWSFKELFKKLIVQSKKGLSEKSQKLIF